MRITPQVASLPAVARLDGLWEQDVAASGCPILLPPYDLRTAGGSEQARREHLSIYIPDVSKAIFLI